MKRTAASLLIMLAMVMVMVNFAFAADETASETWQVSVGKETASTSIDSMFPKVVYIHEGDKVVFANGAKFTPHTVTFLAGNAPLSPQDPAHAVASVPSGSSWDGTTLLNSGILPPGVGKYEVTFTKSGAYAYYCVLHPMMTGTVVVIPKGQPIPSKVEQAAATKAQEQDILVQAEMMHGNMAPQYTKNTDGTLTYQVGMGTPNSSFSHNRMMPDLAVVAEGDSVQWTNSSPYEPHFVTFNKPKDLNFFTPAMDFNPVFMAPAGKKSFDGTGFTNSGMIMSSQSYTLKFTKAGTYAYECYLHSGSKMTGTVVVVPKNAVKLIVNGKVVTDAKAQWKGTGVNVSAAAFAKALGGKAVAGGKTVTVTAGKFKAVVNAAGGMASAEEIVRGMGGSYGWDQQTKTLTVNVGAVAATPAAAPATSAAGHSH
jgi:plastocyanin